MDADMLTEKRRIWKMEAATMSSAERQQKIVDLQIEIWQKDQEYRRHQEEQMRVRGLTVWIPFISLIIHIIYHLFILHLC
jgi:hypothetical protein